MSKNESGKWIAGIVMLALAVIIYFLGKNIIPTPSMCSGSWAIINPICWGVSAGNFLFGILFTVLAIWTALFGIMIFALPAEKAIWAIIFYIAFTFAVVNIFVPDPIPFVDEFISFAFSGFAAIKTFSDKEVKEVVTF